MKLLSIVLSIFISLAVVAEDCPVAVSVSNVYFQYMQEDQVVAIDVELERLNDDDKKCKKVLLGVTTGISGSYERKLHSIQQAIDYNIYKDEQLNKVLESIDDAKDKDLVKIDFKKDLTKTVTIYAQLPNPNLGSTIPPGIYFDNVNVQVKPEKKNDTGGGQKRMSLFLNVLSDLNISLVDKGQPFNYFQTNYSINYGEMVEGQTKGLNLIVKSNAGYQISVSSENDGVMKHTNVDTQKVNYDFVVNGSPMSLIGSKASPLVIYSSPSQSPDDGDVIDIDVVIKSLRNKRAGIYRDFIYINAISTN